ncbi:nucleotide sugar transporter SLC35B4 isoform X2 [Calonectris borealis]|uniref:nucleotide sugar transporter SLC35B4 isoform X2 n=1 Tax=Calonectris borealis TaxID=1323832 RepID=UPI003F4BBFF3
MHPAVAVGLVFGGCCSNVVFLELLVRPFPGCGNIVTFSQFLFIAVEGFIFEANFGRKRPAIPIRNYLIMVAMFFTVSVVNNCALSLHISMPLHMIFRSGSLIANMALGIIILKKRYCRTHLRPPHVCQDGDFPGDAVQAVWEALQRGPFLQSCVTAPWLSPLCPKHLRPCSPLQPVRAVPGPSDRADPPNHVVLPPHERHHSIRLRPRRLHPHHGVHLPHRHAGGDAAQVRQPHLLHPLLSQPLHGLALAGHRLRLRGDCHVHGGVEQPGALPGPLEEEAEGGLAAGDSLQGPFYCFIEQSMRESPRGGLFL